MHFLQIQTQGTYSNVIILIILALIVAFYAGYKYGFLKGKIKK